MNWQTFIQTLQQAGISIMLNDQQQVTVSGAVSNSDTIRQQLGAFIKQHKAGIVSLLELKTQDPELWHAIIRGNKQDIFIQLQQDTEQLQQGKRPDSYGYTGTCRQCGEVYLPCQLKAVALGCPWCQRTAQGLTIPRPTQH